MRCTSERPVMGGCHGAALAAAALWLGLACAAPDRAPAPEATEGHRQFRRVCSMCHGPNGEGMPRLGKNLHDNAFVAAHSDQELVEFLRQGRPASHPDNERGIDMPPKGGDPALTDQDLSLIVTYMRSLQ